MIKFHNPKSYSLITGTILFLLGFVGFTFKTTFDLPDMYLFFSLVLGFWGIVVGMSAAKQ